MLDFLDRKHICPVWRTTVSADDRFFCISIGTNCAPLHVYEAEYQQGLITNKDRKLSQIFNSNFRYIDSVNDQFSIP